MIKKIGSILQSRGATKDDVKRAYESVEQKPVDLVEVVRCKDCRCFQTVEDAILPITLFFCCRNLHITAVAEDDYCSYGERK